MMDAGKDAVACMEIHMHARHRPGDYEIRCRLCDRLDDYRTCPDMPICNESARFRKGKETRSEAAAGTNKDESFRGGVGWLPCRISTLDREV